MWNAHEKGSRVWEYGDRYNIIQVRLLLKAAAQEKRIIINIVLFGRNRAEG